MCTNVIISDTNYLVKTIMENDEILRGNPLTPIFSQIRITLQTLWIRPCLR